MKTIVWVVVLCAIWEWLELNIYGEVQPRIVDEIMLLFFVPFVYGAVSKNAKTSKRRKYKHVR
jgi:hypothetical protein